MSLALFLISLCLLLFGLFSEGMKYVLIVSGLIVNYIGIAILISGVIQRNKENN